MANSSKLLDELASFLRPPGQGIPTFSTGKEELLKKTENYLGSVPSSWRDHLAQVTELRGDDAVALLALPSDTGAGIVRGAARGPEAIREALGEAPCFDLGDVVVVPHLLSEEMLSEEQKSRTQAALDVKGPVSPMGITQRVYEILAELNPKLRVLLIGGDHTVTWPVMAAILAGGPEANRDLGIVHFDAHTDLLPERLGVKYCFATWAYHANELLGRGQRMFQIGIRASGRPKEHWEKECGVRQLWGHEVETMTPEKVAWIVVSHLKDRGVKRVYISNDIDGTDSKWAAACGTPEPGGLTPDQVAAVIEHVGKEFEVIGADIVEVAPVLSLDPQKSKTTVDTAVRYLRAELASMR
jgi:arginase family enzyme